MSHGLAQNSTDLLLQPPTQPGYHLERSRFREDIFKYVLSGNLAAQATSLLGQCLKTCRREMNARLEANISSTILHPDLGPLLALRTDGCRINCFD